MDIDYSKLNYFKSDSPEFEQVLAENPGVSDAYNKAKALIDKSIFKEIASCSLSIYENTIGFFPSFDITSENVMLIRDNPDQWEELFRALTADVGTVTAAKLFRLYSLRQLREFEEAYSSVKITDPKAFAIFVHDSKDNTSPDDGRNVIVSSDGRRWKRTYSES